MKTLYLLMVGLLLCPLTYAVNCKEKADSFVSSAGQVYCNKDDYEEQLECLNEGIKNIKSYCMENSQAKIELDANVAFLKDILLKKSSVDIGSEKYKLAKSKYDFELISTIIESNSYDIENTKSKIIDKYEGLSIEVNDIVADYQRDVNLIISNINNASNASSLSGNEYELQELYFSSARRLNSYYNEIAILQMRAKNLEDKLVGALSEAMDSVEALGLSEQLGLRSRAIDNALLYLKRIDDDIYDKTSKVSDHLVQKRSLYRFSEIDSQLQESTKEAYEIDRIRGYLVQVNSSVEGFQRPERSTFYNMPYLTEQLRSAGQIVNIADACSAADRPSWQSLGCQRALTYKGNAERAFSTTVPNTINFALIRLFPTVVDATKIENLRSALEGDDIVAAAQVYDSILRSL